ncbi:MAG: NUDIX hydrolase [Nocardioidaceae bacterium]
MQIPCVGAIVRDADGRLLVVRRGRPPGIGLWSIPGGRVEPGEALADAVRREVLEETGLDVDVATVAGTVLIPAASPGDSYLVTDFHATVTAGSPTLPVAGDDAAEARWVSQQELVALKTTAGLDRALSDWGVWG